MKHVESPTISCGFSLLELIVVLAGLSLLTSLAVTRIQSSLKNIEVDEGFVHLNSLGAECLALMGNQEFGSQNPPPSPPSLDIKLLESIGYKKNQSYDSCLYLQIDPINANSDSHPSLGFGIFNNKLTKFSISAETTETTDAGLACKKWAGDNCVSDQSKSYNNYFYFMHNVFHNRFKCEEKFAQDLKSNPNPSNNTLNRWDETKSQSCSIKTPEQNTTTGYISQTCTSSNACSKKAYVLGGNFVGYKQSDLTTAQSTACSNSISEYIQSYGGGAEEKNDLENCEGKTIYICNSMQYTNVNSYKACEIEQAIEKCKIELEDMRKEMPNGEAKVSGEGLPPCGQKVWICNDTIYESQEQFADECS